MRVEEYDLINNLAQAQADITFGHIARERNDFANTELLRILSGTMGRAVVNFAGKDGFVQHQCHDIFWSGYRYILTLRRKCSTQVLYQTLCNMRWWRNLTSVCIPPRIYQSCELCFGKMCGHIERGSDKQERIDSTN